MQSFPVAFMPNSIITPDSMPSVHGLGGDLRLWPQTPTPATQLQPPPFSQLLCLHTLSVVPLHSLFLLTSSLLGILRIASWALGKDSSHISISFSFPSLFLGHLGDIGIRDRVWRPLAHHFSLCQAVLHLTRVLYEL